MILSISNLVLSVCGPPPVRPSRTGRETPAAAGSRTLLVEKALLFQHVEVLAREQPVILGRVPPLREDAGQIGQSVRAEQFGRLGRGFPLRPDTVDRLGRIILVPFAVDNPFPLLSLMKIKQKSLELFQNGDSFLDRGMRGKKSAKSTEGTFRLVARILNE